MGKSRAVGKSFVIDRKRWGQQYLLDGVGGKMCCLGFLGESCGVSAGELLGRALPKSIVKSAQRALFPPAFQVVGGISGELARINDDCDLPQDIKEQSIIEIFATEGWMVSFK